MNLKTSLLLAIVPIMQCMTFNANDEFQSLKHPYAHKPYVYQMNDTEYVDPSQRNSTMRIVVEEEFFTNIQENFINQFLNVISTSVTNLTLLKDQILTIPNVVSLNVSVWEFYLRDMRIDNTSEKLVVLGDNNTVTLNLKNLKGEMTASYMYITDPPLLADVGDFVWQFNDTSLKLGGTLYLEDGVPQMEIKDLDFYAKPFAIELDGVSDLSEVASSLITFVGNILRTRLISISHYLQDTDPTKIQNLVNSLLGQIPDVFYLGENMYLEGGIHNNPYVKPADFLEINLDLSLQDDRHPLKDLNQANFSGTTSQDQYQLQLYLSEYLIQSVITTLYWEDYFVLPAQKLDSTLMAGLKLLIMVVGNN